MLIFPGRIVIVGRLRLVRFGGGFGLSALKDYYKDATCFCGKQEGRTTCCSCDDGDRVLQALLF